MKNTKEVPKKKKKKKPKIGKKKFIKKRTLIIQTIAKERIEFLMKKALEIYAENPSLGERYGEIVRAYSRSTKTPIPPNYKKLFCHKCKKLMIPGITGRYRIQSRKKRGSRYVITCLHCNHMVHIYFKKRKPKVISDHNEENNKTHQNNSKKNYENKEL